MRYYPSIIPYTQAHPHLSPNMPHFKSASCVDFQVTATLSFPESPRACHLWCHNSVEHHVALATSHVSSACDPLLWGMTSLVKMTTPWVHTKSRMMVVQAVYSPKPWLTLHLSPVTVALLTKHFIPLTQCLLMSLLLCLEWHYSRLCLEKPNLDSWSRLSSSIWRSF